MGLLLGASLQESKGLPSSSTKMSLRPQLGLGDGMGADLPVELDGYTRSITSGWPRHCKHLKNVCLNLAVVVDAFNPRTLGSRGRQSL